MLLLPFVEIFVQSMEAPFALCAWRVSEIPRAVPRQQADAHPAGELGRQRPHHHGHLLLPGLLQRVGDQVHPHVRTEVSGLATLLFSPYLVSAFPIHSASFLPLLLTF